MMGAAANTAVTAKFDEGVTVSGLMVLSLGKVSTTTVGRAFTNHPANRGNNDPKRVNLNVKIVGEGAPVDHTANMNVESNTLFYPGTSTTLNTLVLKTGTHTKFLRPSSTLTAQRLVVKDGLSVSEDTRITTMSPSPVGSQSDALVHVAKSAYVGGHTLLSGFMTVKFGPCPCDDDACDNDPSVVAVKRKIQNVTGVSQENYEHLQILRYEKGQFYRTHHDMQPGENDMAAGPRVLTFFLYLSDVEEGGETNFPRLDDLDVRPRKGRALLWPSVLSNDPTLRDERTFHQAKDVLKGVKYAANAWIHSYNYRIPNHWGCSGSFD